MYKLEDRESDTDNSLFKVVGLVLFNIVIWFILAYLVYNFIKFLVNIIKSLIIWFIQ